MTAADRPAKSPRPCSICGKMSVAAFHPFCSKRCADVDLNRWLGGVYRVETDESPRNPPLAKDDGNED